MPGVEHLAVVGSQLSSSSQPPSQSRTWITKNGHSRACVGVVIVYCSSFWIFKAFQFRIAGTDLGMGRVCVCGGGGGGGAKQAK